MKLYIFKLFFIICSILLLQNQTLTKTKPAKIVGLVQARNEDNIAEQCLRILAMYTDAIVFLDDNSSDATAAITQKLSQELSIERIILQPYSGWEKTSESANRQTLLDHGRAIGGTHFILIDADEFFMAPCAKNAHATNINDGYVTNNWLRTHILSLKPGQYISFPMVNVWGSLSVYRDDDFCSPKDNTWSKKPIIFCDDGNCFYTHPNISVSPKNNMLHGSRIPRNLRCQETTQQFIVNNLNYGIVHTKWVNFENITTKKIWYMMLEYIRAHEHSSYLLCKSQKAHKHSSNLFHKSQKTSEIERTYNYNQNNIADIINNFYNNKELKGMMPEEKNIVLKPVPQSWYDYPFFDATCYTQTNQSRKCDIARWLSTYGPDYFSDLSFDTNS